MRERQDEHTEAVGSHANIAPAIEPTPPKRRRIRTKTSIQQLSLRGLNIEWPYSQLILAGLRTVEVRGYGLGFKNPNVLPGEEVWLIETLGPKKARKNAIGDRRDIGQRPKRAQIVGTVIFSQAEQYADVDAFRADAGRHCIEERGAHVWDGRGDRYAWHVWAVRALSKPICGPVKTVQGIRKHTSFEVSFVTPVTLEETVVSDVAPEDSTIQASAPDEEWYDCDSGYEEYEHCDDWQGLDKLEEMQDWDGAAAHKSMVAQNSQGPAAAETEVYFERQLGAWCGMHALNNYLGGAYVTKKDCQAAA